MSHNHSHHSHSDAHDSTKNIAIAFVLNFLFAIFEIVGGIITGSTAILSDAVHDFGDSLSLGISLIFQKVSDKAPTEKYSLGFGRISIIGAIINVLVLLVGTVFVFMEAIYRFRNPRDVMAEGMFFMAILGIIVNGISVFRMKGSKKILDKTVMIHLLEDLLGWIAVFVVSIIMYFTKLYILDPVLSVIICLIIAKNIISNIKNIFDIIMNATPDIALLRHIQEHIIKIPEVVGVERINMWSIDGEQHILMAQIITTDNADKNLLREIKDIIKMEGISYSNIELIEN